LRRLASGQPDYIHSRILPELPTAIMIPIIVDLGVSCDMTSTYPTKQIHTPTLQPDPTPARLRAASETRNGITAAARLLV